jgi:hypothetical protein
LRATEELGSFDLEPGGTSAAVTDAELGLDLGKDITEETRLSLDTLSLLTPLVFVEAIDALGAEKRPVDLVLTAAVSFGSGLSPLAAGKRGF